MDDKIKNITDLRVQDLPVTDNVQSDDYFVIEKEDGTHKISARNMDASRVDVVNSLNSDSLKDALSANMGKVLNAKIEQKEVIDNLISTNKDASLSANMGRELNEKIDDVTLNVIDDLVTVSRSQPLSANQGVVLKRMVDKLAEVDVIDNLVSTSPTDALSANMGRVLDKKITNASIEVVDNLDSSRPDVALSGNQGRILKRMIDDNAVEIVDNLDSTDGTAVLSANMGRELEAKIIDSHTPLIDNLNSTSVNSGLTANQGRILKEKLNEVPVITVVNSLTSEAYVDTALSAKQGSVLNTKIESIERTQVEVVNNFDGGATKALSSLKGKELKTELDSIPRITVVNNLRAYTSPNPDAEQNDALSANMGRVLNEKIDAMRVPVINNLNYTGDPGKALDALQGPIINTRLNSSGNKIKIVGNNITLISVRGSEEVVLSELSLPSVKLIDNLTSTDVSRALTANQGRVLNETKASNITFRNNVLQLEGSNGLIGRAITIPKVDVIDNLSSDSGINALSAKQGKELNTRISSVQGEIPDVVNAFTTDTDKALSSAKGLELYNDKADDVLVTADNHVQLTSNGIPVGTKKRLPLTAVVNRLDSTSETSALSANQGRILQQSKMEGLTLVGKTLKKITGAGTESGGIALPIPNVSNNLTTTTAGTTLDASQGKILNDRINSVRAAIPAVINDLATTTTGKSLDAVQGKLLNDTKAQALIYDSLSQKIRLSNGAAGIGNEIQLKIPPSTTALNISGPGFVLDARAGADLQSQIDSMKASGGTEIVNLLTSTKTNAALSANMGKVLNETKADGIKLTGNIIQLTSGSTAIGQQITIPMVTVATSFENSSSKALAASLGFQLQGKKFDEVSVVGTTMNFNANGKQVASANIPGVSLVDTPMGDNTSSGLSQKGGHAIWKRTPEELSATGSTVKLTLVDGTILTADVEVPQPYDGLDATEAGQSLDARQGKALYDLITNTVSPTIVTDFNDSDDTKVASAGTVYQLARRKLENLMFDPTTDIITMYKGIGGESGNIQLPYAKKTDVASQETKIQKITTDLNSKMLTLSNLMIALRNIVSELNTAKMTQVSINRIVAETLESVNLANANSIKDFNSNIAGDVVTSLISSGLTTTDINGLRVPTKSKKGGK